MDWPLIPFSKAAKDRTRGQKKVLRRDYLAEGRVPVIDQGQNLVAGYTNDESAAYDGALPVILFGDHTRSLKYIDFRFALGADGVKALEPSSLFDGRFLYHCLSNLDLPAHGYSRHFKFLKATEVPLPPPSEQRRIVKILDRAERLRRLRSESNTKASRILPALFVRMFGDPATNPMGWDVEPLACVAQTSSGGTPATKRTDYYGGAIPWVKSGELRARVVKTTEQTITEEGLRNSSAKWCEPGSVLLAMYGATVGEVAKLAIRATTNQAVCALWPGDRLHRDYLAEFLRLSKQTLLARRVGGAQPNISQEIIRRLEVPLPPLELQQEFASRVGAVESTLERGEVADARISDVFQTLMARAFSGSLTEEWRDAHAVELEHEAESQAKVLEGRA